MKKLLAVVLVISLAIPLGGCGGGTQKPKPTPKPTPVVKTQVTVGLPGLKEAASGKPSGDMRQLFIDRFGIEFVPWRPSNANDWEGSIKAAAASKTLPEVFSEAAFGNRTLFKQLIDQNLVREIPEAIYKNYRNLGTTMYRYAKTESVNGKMYFLPRSEMAKEYNNGGSMAIYYRLDWALKSGAMTADQPPEWKLFMDFMEYCTSKDPDDNGSNDTWGLTCGGPGLGGMKTAFFTTFGVRDWVLEGGKWIPGLLSERAKEAAKWASLGLRKSGYIDPAFSTQTQDEALEKFCSGKAGMLVYDASPAGVARMAALFQMRQPGVDVAQAVSILPQPVDPWGVSYNEDASYYTGTFFSSSVDDQKLKKIFSLMDWLYNDEGLNYVNWGQQGKDYNVTGSGYQTLHKGQNNLPVTFGALNAEWSPMATLATWGKDYIPEPKKDDYRLKYLGILRDSWWKNIWRKPMFTRYIFNESVQNFDSDGKAEAALANMIMKSGNIDADWQAYVTQMTTELNVDAVSKIVNDYAAKNKITKEE